MTTATATKRVNLKFDPVNDAQLGFMNSKAPRLLFSGAFGAGKSVALCAKGLKLSIDYPGNVGLICRKTRASMTNTTLRTWFERVCPNDLIKSYNKTEGNLELYNGSRVLFGGLDDPLKLGSLELGWCGIDEAIETTEDDWRMIEGRLRLPNVLHQIFAATNPGPPSHYLYKLFFAGNHSKQNEAYQASTLENPELPADYIERVKEYEGVYYDRYVLGLWKGLEGLVYSTFDEKSCLVKRFEIPKQWLVYSGHDFGGANPAAIFYAQDSTTGLLYAFAEYLPGLGRGIYDHVKEFKAITEGYTVVRRSGGSHQEEEIRQGYTAQGWPIMEPWLNDVSAGIQRVLSLHKTNKIIVFDDLSNYLREKLSYAYQVKDGQTTDEIDSKHKFHLMDAERYILSSFQPETLPSRGFGKAVDY